MKRQLTENKVKVKKPKKYLTENKLKEIVAVFLSDKKHANIVVDLLDQFHKPSETPTAYVNAVENIFGEVLRRQDMVIADDTNEVERQYKDWLCQRYKDALDKLYLCYQKGSSECKLQALNTLFKLLSIEAKFPIVSKKKKNKSKKKNMTVVVRLKAILKSSSLSSNLSAEILKRWSEYAEYKDVRYNLWLAVDSLLQETCQKQPIDKQMWNILLILSKIPKTKKVSDIVLCEGKNVVPEERTVNSAVESVWKQLAKWQYSATTQQLLLVVLVEQIMPQMDNAIYLTDYFMDALAKDECEINMLALQGIFNLVIKHNIEYPDIFGKLYQMFTENTLKAKYKTRLFALADEFLRSTHLPLALVAAFAKRFARLLFLASPPDAVILLTFIANLLIRHPDLRFLCHNPDGKEVDDDPYLQDEKDPLKSKALDSQLWEVRLLQQHYSEKVAKMAAVFNNDLPSVEYELEPLLERTWMEMIKKDLKILKKKIPQVAAKFEDKPLSSKALEARRKEDELIWDVCDIKKLFIINNHSIKLNNCL